MLDSSPSEESWSTEYSEKKLPYKHLGSDELRLLTVHPPLTTRKDELIRCSLEYASLGDVNLDYDPDVDPRYTWGDYIAISYCWGWDADSPSRRIIINGHLFQVTENLEAVLQAIRISNSTTAVSWPTKYWIDAVCINQADSSEIQREILRMRDIYSQAMGVFIHLGPEMDDSSLAIELLHSLSTQLAGGIDCAKTLLDIRFQPSKEDRKAYRAIVKLLGRPYWHRVWILQELAMSNSNMTVWCGLHKISFRDVVSVSRFLCLNGENLQLIAGADLGSEYPHLMTTMWVAMWANDARDQRQRLRSSQNPTYLDLRLPLLTLAQNAQATKPHDKVYGLLGLMPEAIRTKMEPYIDYNLPVNAVYAAFSRAVIEFTGDLDIIFAKNFEQTMSPTWATDWQLPFDRAGMPHDWQLYCYDQFPGAYDNLYKVIDASRNARADGGRRSRVHFEDTFDNSLLKCSGILIGTIDGIATCIPNRFSTISTTTYACVQPVRQDHPYGNDRAASRALIHALFANPMWGDPEGAALFRIPWIAGEASSMFNADGSLSTDESVENRIHQLRELGWQAAIGNDFFFFEWMRRRLSEFHIGGKKFADYFSREFVQCPFPEQRIKLDIATVRGAALARSLITLSTGHFGLAPNTAQAGDGVYVLLGCSFPVVLRSEAHTGHFKVVGECYVEGFTNGEAVEGLEQGKSHLQEIILC